MTGPLYVPLSGLLLRELYTKIAPKFGTWDLRTHHIINNFFIKNAIIFNWCGALFSIKSIFNM